MNINTIHAHYFTVKEYKNTFLIARAISIQAAEIAEKHRTPLADSEIAAYH